MSWGHVGPQYTKPPGRESQYYKEAVSIMMCVCFSVKYIRPEFYTVWHSDDASCRMIYLVESGWALLYSRISIVLLRPRYFLELTYTGGGGGGQPTPCNFENKNWTWRLGGLHLSNNRENGCLVVPTPETLPGLPWNVYLAVQGLQVNIHLNCMHSIPPKNSGVIFFCEATCIPCSMT